MSERDAEHAMVLALSIKVDINILKVFTLSVNVLGLKIACDKESAAELLVIAQIKNLISRTLGPPASPCLI